MRVQSRIVTALCFLVPPLFPPSLLAQVFTLDYLTYSDHAFQSPLDYSKGRLTSYIYFADGAFEESRTANYNGRSYREIHLCASPRIYNGHNVQFNFSFRTGLFSRHAIYGYIWAMPWIWGKIKILESPQLALRLGFEWAEFGSPYWINDNKFDLGLMSNKELRYLLMEAGLSYRLRSKNNRVRYGDGYQDHAGNEIHYKLEALKEIAPKVMCSILVMGYHGSSKSLDDDASGGDVK